MVVNVNEYCCVPGSWIYSHNQYKDHSNTTDNESHKLIIEFYCIHILFTNQSNPIQINKHITQLI